MPILRTGTLTRIEPSPNAFTLLELMVVLSTVGLLVALALPVIGVHDALAEHARRIAGTIHTLREASLSSREVHRLYFDMDQQMYWATVVGRAGERLYSDPSLAGGIMVSDPVRIGEVATSRAGKRSIGRAALEIHPDGRVDPGVILLFGENDRMLWLKVDRYSGHVGMARRADDPNPRAIPSTILPLFRPLPPAPAAPRM